MSSNVCVLYLHYPPYGKELLKTFLSSYFEYPTGYPCDLIIFNQLDGMLDINGYDTMITTHADYNFYLLLNSYSRIISSDWLLKMMQYAGTKTVVGATGSWESWPMINAPPFPNYHLRTTGVLFPARAWIWNHTHEECATKADCWALESGQNSWTRQLLRQKYRIGIVGANGKFYTPQDWGKSGTFQQGNQENLLIADNHTDGYAHMPLKEREERQMKVWGKICQ